MNAESKIGFVVPHAERRGGHHRFDAVLEQLGLHEQPIGPVHGSGVFGDVVTGAAQEPGEATGLGNSEHIDDAGAMQRLEGLVHPGEAFHRCEIADHGQL